MKLTAILMMMIAASSAGAGGVAMAGFPADVGTVVETEEHGARIVFESDSHDFGEFRADSIQETVFTFSNEGDSTLVLTKVFSDCGCTVPTYPRDSIPPGGRGDITVRFNGKGRVPGSFIKMIKVRSNAIKPLVRLYIKGKVIPNS